MQALFYVEGPAYRLVHGLSMIGSPPDAPGRSPDTGRRAATVRYVHSGRQHPSTIGAPWRSTTPSRDQLPAVGTGPRSPGPSGGSLSAVRCRRPPSRSKPTCWPSFTGPKHALATLATRARGTRSPSLRRPGPHRCQPIHPRHRASSCPHRHARAPLNSLCPVPVGAVDRWFIAGLWWRDCWPPCSHSLIRTRRPSVTVAAL